MGWYRSKFESGLQTDNRPELKIYIQGITEVVGYDENAEKKRLVTKFCGIPSFSALLEKRQRNQRRRDGGQEAQNQIVEA